MSDGERKRADEPAWSSSRAFPAFVEHRRS
jgi:hypothetical protein